MWGQQYLLHMANMKIQADFCHKRVGKILEHLSVIDSFVAIPYTKGPPKAVVKQGEERKWRGIFMREKQNREKRASQ